MKTPLEGAALDVAQRDLIAAGWPPLTAQHIVSLAQLGARVLEILRDPAGVASDQAESHAAWEGSKHECRCEFCIGERLMSRDPDLTLAHIKLVLATACELGLLSEAQRFGDPKTARSLGLLSEGGGK